MVETLVERAVSGDAAAFAELVRTQYSLIYRIAYKWSGNAQDAEDIAQDVCIKLGKSLQSFAGQSAFSSWLYRITLNTVHDFQRSRARHQVKHSALALVCEEQYEPDQDKHLLNDEIWAQVSLLPEKQCDAVLLVYAEELSHKEAAQIMGCSESTVSWHIHEAKKGLKTLLDGDANG